MSLCFRQDFLAGVLAARHGFSFHTNFSFHAVLALAAGLLILVRPKFLNFIVAAYLIVIGVVGIFDLRW